VIRVSVRSSVDFATLADQWRALEHRSDASFFLSWTWIGCLAAERFPNPVLVEAVEDGRTVALALFNRVHRWGLPVLYLHESGDPELDCPYIEHNGILTETGRAAELTPLCLTAVARRYRLVLSGIDGICLNAIRSVAAFYRLHRAQPAHFADLARLRGSDANYLASRSPNTRQQIRRSERYFAALADGGPVTVTEADSVPEGLAMLDALAALHQATWVSRGKPGAFARPFFRRFHRALIEAGLPSGLIALQKVTAGDIIIGYLYNFRFRNQMLAYQSGLQYRDEVSAARPGLLAHTAAIGEAVPQNIDIYDFLAGDDRYKRSLSDSSHTLSWVEAGPFWTYILTAGWALDHLKNGWRWLRKRRHILHLPWKRRA
jgi:CelD/BcsL family acetyltransferase involved in cellulose biosynthesis